MQVSSNFIIQEFIPKGIWDSFGEKSVWFIRPEIITLAQFYHDFFGKRVTVNNWNAGGEFFERGYRFPDTNTGARLSQHKFGNAFDCTIEGMTADEARAIIMKNEALFMSKGLTCLESAKDAPTWVHSDCRNTGLKNILIVDAI